jgi:hypothetical protein
MTDLIFFFVFVLALGYVVWVFRSLAIKQMAELTAIETRKTQVISDAIKSPAPASEADLMQKEIGTNRYSTFLFRQDVSVKQFTETLAALVDTVEVIRDVQEEYDNKMTLKITLAGVSHILVISYLNALANSFLSDKFDIKGVVEEDRFKLSLLIKLLTPHQECEDECVNGMMTSIREAIELSVVHSEKLSKGSTIQVYDLLSSMGNLAFRAANFSFHEMARTLMNISFNNLPIHLGNEQYIVPAGETLDYLVDELSAGRNVMLLGGPGTGKTVLASNIVAELLKKPNIHILRLDYSTIAELAQPTGKSTLASHVSRAANSGVDTFIFYVDEGQAIANSTQLTPLLQLMEGMQLGDVTIGVLAALSAKRNDLDAALLRPGRAHNILELSVLKANKITALASYIQRNLKLVPDQNALDTFVARNSATLAEVWGAHTKAETVSKYGSLFERYKVAQPKLKVVKSA